MAIGDNLRYLLSFFVIFVLMFSFVGANDSKTDNEKKEILLSSYCESYFEALWFEGTPKRSCGWIAHRTWELGTERGIDVDAVWVCKMDRHHSHIIPVVMLTNGVYYGYQPSHYPYDYYSKNYFGIQEIFDTWDFQIVDPSIGSSWPVNISYKDKRGRIYIKSENIGGN